MIDKYLIEKFLRGECQDDEAAYVKRYLRQHPDAVEEFLPEQEWDKYVSSQPSPAVDEELYQNIEQSIHRSKRGKRILTTLVSAAAVLLLFFGIRYLNQGSPAAGSNELATTSETIKKNNTTAAQQLRLPDNTLVTLSPGSEIRYADNYNSTKREIHLTGKAEFDVAKNKEKQFTVFCGKVATTALGTRFSVDGNASSISVALFEGKVVVKKLQDETIANYLLPGDRIRFNIGKDLFEKFPDNHLAATSPAGTLKTGPEKRTPGADPVTDEHDQSENSVASADNNGQINFQNKNLKTVLDQLAERFKVEINYPTEISASINVFISVDTTQSIDRILHNIAAINNLEVKKVADRKFYISK
ncbi:MAG: FecR family protein [Pseudobacter sp.]|uniref:FecR family protein n=1 Tax=Pseudobacter sp. TaxID=2045420 RepID=UPI003F7CD4BC